MTKYVLLLRGINVGGREKILMKDLQRLYYNLGFSIVQTYIQSGNVVFEVYDSYNNEDLSKIIEEAIFKTYKFSVSVFLMSAQEFNNIVKQNPYLNKNNIDLSRLYVTLLHNLPMQENIANLIEMDFSDEQFQIINKSIFICYSGKISDSKLTGKVIESKLKTVSTTRNWKTMLSLQKFKVMIFNIQLNCLLNKRLIILNLKQPIGCFFLHL